jgi:hypothetical protein
MPGLLLVDGRNLMEEEKRHSGDEANSNFNELGIASVANTVAVHY